MRYIIRIESERLKMMKKESIFDVTFEDGGSVFIQAMDEGHARRIVETNNLWRWNTEDEGHSRTVRKIEKV